MAEKSIFRKNHFLDGDNIILNNEMEYFGKYLNEMKEIASEYGIKIETFNAAEIEDFKKKVNWKDIGKNRRLSEIFVRLHGDNLDWRSITETQTHLSEACLDIYANKFGKEEWENISRYFRLSCNFKRLYQRELSNMGNSR